MRRPSSAAISAVRSASALARHAGSSSIRRRAAVNVLPVLDGEVLQIAQPGIDATQRLVGRQQPQPTPASSRQSGALRCLDNQFGQSLAAAAVEAVGLGIFFEQTFELMGVAAWPAGNEWWRQMANGQSGDAALGLRRFARIADDKGIDHRQCAGDDFGKAFRG